jgi:hypothetical protein
MRLFKKNKRKPEYGASKQSNWSKGLNTLVSNTQIKPNELSEANNIQLVEDGKIQCPRDGQAYYGQEDGDKITGVFPYYKSDGTVELLRISGTELQKYNAGSWDVISGKTYTTSLDTQGVMAYDKLYLVNGTDALTYYDGSAVQTFTALTAPSSPTVAVSTGTNGTYTYSYKVSAVSAVGETTPSSAVSQTATVATLDATSYMTVTWTAVSNATGYNLYGRKAGMWYFMTNVEGNATLTYADKGTITPQEAFQPPEGNTTGGVVGKYICLYKDSLFIAGDPSNPSRLYYSAGGDLVNDFTVGNGGGFIDIAKNDGNKITGLIVFKDSILVFKDRAIYKFQFTTSGLPSVEQVTASVGAIAPRSIVAVENDIYFYAGARGIFTIGNEAGFAFDVLRTNELSSPVRSIIQSISPLREKNVAAIYATVANKNLVIFSYTPSGGTYNTEALVYDRERLGWYKWTNIQANCFTNYRDDAGSEHILYGDDNSGYLKEMFAGGDDFGTSIVGTLRLRSEDFKQPERYKKLKRIDLILREPTGTVTMNVIKDGVTTELSTPITTVQPSVNWGHYVFSDYLFGESSSDDERTTQDDNLLRTSKNPNLEKGRSYMLELKNSSGGSFVLLYAGMKAKFKSESYRQAEDLVE